MHIKKEFGKTSNPFMSGCINCDAGWKPASQSLTMIKGILFCLAMLIILNSSANAITLPAGVVNPVTVSGMIEFHEKLLIGTKKASKVENVVVYLQPNDDKTKDILSHYPIETVWLNQRNKTFIPHVIAVQKNGKVRFGNEDPWFHNIYSNDPKFNLGRYPRGFYKEQRFEKTGVFHIFCDIHPTMHGLIVVVDTPLYTYTINDDGSFAIPGVPPGNYQLVAWHERAGFTTQDITVGEKNIANLLINVTAKKRKSSSRPSSRYQNRRSTLNNE